MRTKILFLTLAISAFVLVPLAVTYGGGSFENPTPGSFQSPELRGAAIQSEMRDFQIGFRDTDKSCKVEMITAESPDAALAIAHNECPTCQVQDLTGKEITAEAPWSGVPMAQAFCQLDLYTNPAYK